MKLQSALQGKDAWLAFNITSSQLPKYTAIASKLKLSRVVFGVHLNKDEEGPDLIFDESCDMLRSAGVNYTVIKFGETRPMEESKYPYRIR